MAKTGAVEDMVQAFLKKWGGQTGVNSRFLEKAARSGMLDLANATPDDIYRVASQIAAPPPSRQLELPLGPSAAEPDIRALIPTQSAGELARIDNGYRGYSIPGSTPPPTGLVTVNRSLVPQGRDIAPIDPGYRRGVPVDYVDAEDVSVPLGPMTGRGLPYVDQDAAAQARYRQRTAPAVEYGNELDAARRFRESTTDPKASLADTLVDLSRRGADAIGGAGRAASDFAASPRGQAMLNGAAKAALATGGAGVAGAGAYALSKAMESDAPAVASGGEADLAAASRPAPVVAPTNAQEPKPALTSAAGEDKNLEASATQVTPGVRPPSPGDERRQMRQMPIERPAPATDLAQQEELKLIDGNAHLNRQPTPSELTADYRKERSMYDLARRTGKSIEELRKLPEFANVGAARGGDYTRADGSTGTMRSSAARDLAAQARIDDERQRMDRWKAQMLLSSSNSRANMANAFNMLSPEAQQRVLESRMTYGGNAPQMDPRVQAAMLEAEARTRQHGETLKAQAELSKQERDARAENARLDREAEDRRRKESSDLARENLAAILRGQDVSAQTAAGNNNASLISALGGLGMQWFLNQATNATNRYIADSRQPKADPTEKIRSDMAKYQLDQQKPIQVRAQEQVASGNLFHPDVLAHANSIVDNHYSAPTFLGNTSDFTDGELGGAAQKLAFETGMSPKEAADIMRSIQADRRRNATASTIVASFYDR